MGATALVAVAVAAFAITQGGGSQAAVADPSDLLQRSTQAKQAAGCSDAENVGPFQPQTQDQSHVTPEQEPPFSAYPSIPPASGPHNEVPLGAGVYSSAPSMGRVIHSLEHGGVVVWYSPDAGGEELDDLRAFYEDHAVAGSRVIVAPFDYPDQGASGSLPNGIQMAMTAWHYVEDCAQVNLAAAFDFTARYAFPPFGDQRYLGEAPERGGQM